MENKLNLVNDEFVIEDGVLVKYTGDEKEVVIPDGVITIGQLALANCKSLTSITIPDSVTSIDNAAFYACGSLASITVPDGVTNIGGSAFHDCNSLTTVIIPNSVTNIGRYAFLCCRSLTSITLPNSVISIGEEAFGGCSSLTSVVIGDGVTSIGSNAFANCMNLTSIEVNENNLYYSDIDGVLFNKDKTEIICYPNKNGEEYIIPSSVTSIGDYAFNQCDSLINITIPQNLTSIGTRAFYECNLSYVEIPNSVTNIGEYAFHIFDIDAYWEAKKDCEGACYHCDDDECDCCDCVYNSSNIEKENFLVSKICIVASLDSYAAQYAKENNIELEIIEGGEKS